MPPKLNIRDPEELTEEQNDFLRRLTQRLALLSQECGLSGFITPGDQIKAVREYCDLDFQIFATGVRPPWAPLGDHKRAVTPYQAFKDGADRIINGDSIINPSLEIGSRVSAVKKIAEEIEKALEERGY